MKNMVGGRGAPMWGMGWSGFVVVMIAALCISVIYVFRPHARASDGKIMTYGLSTVMMAPSGAKAGKTAAAEAARTRGSDLSPGAAENAPPQAELFIGARRHVRALRNLM